MAGWPHFRHTWRIIIRRLGINCVVPPGTTPGSTKRRSVALHDLASNSQASTLRSGAISSLSASPRSIARSLASFFRLCLCFLYYRSRSSYGVEVLARKIGKRSIHHYIVFSLVFSAFCIPSRRDKVKFARSCYYFPRSLFIFLFLFGTLSVCTSSSSSSS